MKIFGKNLNKTYLQSVKCLNCRSEFCVSIPLGTTKKEFAKKLKDIVCDDYANPCGCKGVKYVK